MYALCSQLNSKYIGNALYGRFFVFEAASTLAIMIDYAFLVKEDDADNVIMSLECILRDIKENFPIIEDEIF